MDPNQLDRLARLAATSGSRRQLLRAGVAALAGTLAARQAVQAGQACDSGLTDCFGNCVALQTDVLHCGACGNACMGVPGPGQSDIGECVAGVCQVVCLEGYTLVDGVCVPTTEVCDPGLTECVGVCVDPQTDVYHCGACGNACVGVPGPGQSSIGECVAGVCQIVCLEGYTLCDGECVDLASDTSNCGACGSICESQLVGVACVEGECVRVDCPAALNSCDGECVDVTSDPANCGACGNACPSGVCAGGACLPNDDDDDADTDTTGGIITLPNTGSGSDTERPGRNWTPAALLAGAAALGAAAVRRASGPAGD